LKTLGISAVIAPTFARIFYRNAFNIGLPIMESPQAAKKINAGDKIEVDLAGGVIKNLTKKETYKAEPLPEFMRELIESGGLVGYVQKNLKK
jgi:3-isopropylmalate dehydratase small subunit